MSPARAALLAAAALAAAAAAPAAARAESIAYGHHEYRPPPKPRDPWTSLRFEGAIGALIGGQRVGWVSGFAGGLHLDAGVRRDRWMIYGDYDFLSVGDTSASGSPGPRGHMHRVGANARYSLVAFGGGREPVRGDVWLEGGIGHQHIRWHGGGILRRRDLSLGLGAQATFKIGGGDRPRYVGIHYAVRAFVAPAPSRKDTPPTCAGPCDEPTGPMPYDLGVFFNFGVPFGK